MSSNLAIRKVNQLDSTGCGLACVAMLAGVNYIDVKNVTLKIFKSWQMSTKAFYTDEVQIRKLLRYYDIRYGHIREFYEWHEVANRTAIVAVNQNKKNNWHWVVHHIDEEGPFVFDPLSPTEKRRNLNRSRPYFFIPIKLEQNA